jgi:hypothetical protein
MTKPIEERYRSDGQAGAIDKIDISEQLIERAAKFLRDQYDELPSTAERLAGRMLREILCAID